MKLKIRVTELVFQLNYFKGNFFQSLQTMPYREHTFIVLQ